MPTRTSVKNKTTRPRKKKENNAPTSTASSTDAGSLNDDSSSYTSLNESSLTNKIDSSSSDTTAAPPTPNEPIKDANTVLIESSKNKANALLNVTKKRLKTKNPSSRLAIHTKLNNSLNVSLNASLSLHNKYSNKKITDYFQIRKSSRKCKSDLEKEKRENIESSIKAMSEDGLEVKVIENKGRGVFATRYFQKGDFVCEYAGEMISYQQAKKREEMYGKDPSIGCYMYFFEHKSKSYCVDATAETSRLGRLLNHSKLGGNCHTKLFEIGARPYLILVASRDIRPGEEMTYDYGDRNKSSIESHPWLAQ
jgi:histone-lysine N-methyltransferase SETD8